MAIDIRVPSLGESITTATVARWLTHAGQAVAADEPIAELETDKVTVEVIAPAAGVLSAIVVPEGTEVEVGALLAVLEGGAAAVSSMGADVSGASAPTEPSPAPNPSSPAPVPGINTGTVPRSVPGTGAGDDGLVRPAGLPLPRTEAPPPPVASAPPAPAASAPAPTTGVRPPPQPIGPVSRPATGQAHAPLPAAAKLMTENAVSQDAIADGSGKDGRITKGDVLAFLARPTPQPAPAAPKPPRAEDPREQRVRMTRLRKTIASRLKEAQNTAAMLTTFNEVDMTAVMTLRSDYRDAFEKKHKGVRLGFMSFFVRACCAALAEFPAVNAEIDGDDIVYRNFVHMGIAVGGASGLVVPVMRDADQLGFAAIEGAIANFGKRARDGGLKLDELTGGTFSITNGGIYGSLMSTPILNPPQSAILGMHKIQDRPMAVAGKVEIRPMMYLALSYDHRVIDGREAVGFLVRVKEGIEDPRRLLLGL